MEEGRERGRRVKGREGEGGMEGGKEGGREWKRKPKMITGDLLLQWFTLRHLVTVVKLGKLLHPVLLQSGGNLPHALGQDPNNVVQDLEHGLGDDLQYLRRNQTETGWDTRRNKMPRLGGIGFQVKWELSVQAPFVYNDRNFVNISTGCCMLGTLIVAHLPDVAHQLPRVVG